MSGLPSSNPSCSGLHPPWECPAPSQFPRYVTSQSTGQGHTPVRPTMSYGSDIRKQRSLPCPRFHDIIAPRSHAPTLPTFFSVSRFLCSLLPPSRSSRNPSQISSLHRSYPRPPSEPSAHIPKCLVPFRVIPKVTPHQYFHEFDVHHRFQNSKG